MRSAVNRLFPLFEKTKLLLLDVDGILTDGTITYTSNGEELKSFSVKDGLGIRLLRESGIKTAVVTARESEMVSRRCKELSIDPVFQNIKKKNEVINKIEKELGINRNNICFMGDDLIDIPVMKLCGITVTVPDSCEEVKNKALYITEKNGGKGAVREVCELILKSKGLWKNAIEIFLNPENHN
ncbi:MAG: HAD-IIIA family hydrolase [Desulfobacteraceae bacterium]|nr:HAD-IIIA family hydrolase [Desulfobacteraceae bacterium]MCB9494897.1 HAD-IIIA family hydrolase [Desulfobacteraceae bacterium]